MCLGMNPDKLIGDQLCASSSNRNFKGRQGSPTGRTVLMSPLMVAAAAVTGEITDAREVFTLQLRVFTMALEQITQVTGRGGICAGRRHRYRSDNSRALHEMRDIRRSWGVCVLR